MTTETDLIAMARECGAIRMLREDRSSNGDHCFSPAQLAALERAILARAAKDVKPVAHIAAGDLPLLKFGMHPIAGAKTAPDDEALYHASTVAAQAARIAELEAQLLAAQADAEDAKLWRWMWNHAQNVSFSYRFGGITKVSVMGLHCGSLKDAVKSAITTIAVRNTP